MHTCKYVTYNVILTCFAHTHTRRDCGRDLECMHTCIYDTCVYATYNVILTCLCTDTHMQRLCERDPKSCRWHCAQNLLQVHSHAYLRLRAFSLSRLSNVSTLSVRGKMYVCAASQIPRGGVPQLHGCLSMDPLHGAEVRTFSG